MAARSTTRSTTELPVKTGAGREESFQVPPPGFPALVFCGSHSGLATALFGEFCVKDAAVAAAGLQLIPPLQFWPANSNPLRSMRADTGGRDEWLSPHGWAPRPTADGPPLTDRLFTFS
jgi:hypothetical protein